MLTATAAWSGRIFGLRTVTTESTAATAARCIVPPPTGEQTSQLGLENSELLPLDSTSWQVRDLATHTDIGMLLTSVPHAKNISGFAGPTPIYIYIDRTDTIRGIAAMQNEETPGFFESATEGMFGQWKGRSVNEVLGTKADIVSGATYSSNALAANIRAALSAYTARNAQMQTAPTVDATKTAAVAVMLLLGIIIAWRFRGNSRLRLVLLVLNVCILGFWCGQFLSLSLLHGWISNGPDWRSGLPALLILGVAVAMSLSGRKKHYCSWVCPYGSLQELAWRLLLPKIRVSPTAYRRMSRLRFGVLILLLLLLWSGLGAELLAYEPFPAFLLSAAAPAVVVLAAVFVVAGLFVPRPWCRMLCPLGALLDLAEQDK